MRTTVTVDDELWQRAKDYTGISETSELIRRALREMVALEAQRRLAALGGTMPDFQAAPRRDSDEWSPGE